MIETIEWFKNASMTEFVFGVICICLLLRLLYEILTDKWS